MMCSLFKKKKVSISHVIYIWQRKVLLIHTPLATSSPTPLYHTFTVFSKFFSQIEPCFFHIILRQCLLLNMQKVLSSENSIFSQLPGDLLINSLAKPRRLCLLTDNYVYVYTDMIAFFENLTSTVTKVLFPNHFDMSFTIWGAVILGFRPTNLKTAYISFHVQSA